MVTAVHADVEREPVTTLPTDFVYTEPEGAGMFALDVEDQENELSSAEEESSRTIRVELEGATPATPSRGPRGRRARQRVPRPPIGVAVEGSVAAEIERRTGGQW